VTPLWLIVVLMALPSPQSSIPSYIPYVYFKTQDECKKHVVQYQYHYFSEAIKMYQGNLMPDRIVCVDKKLFRKLFFNEPPVVEEDL